MLLTSRLLGSFVLTSLTLATSAHAQQRDGTLRVTVALVGENLEVRPARR